MTDVPLGVEGRRKLENALLARDLDRAQAAALINVGRETFSRWLTQGRAIKPKNRAKLKREFGLTDDDFAEPDVNAPDDGRLVTTLDRVLAEAEQSHALLTRIVRAMEAAGIEVPRDVLRGGTR